MQSVVLHKGGCRVLIYIGVDVECCSIYGWMYSVVSHRKDWCVEPNV